MSWIVARRSTAQSTGPDAVTCLRSTYLRPHEIEKDRRTILLVIGFRLELGGVGVEGHQRLQDPVVDRQLNDRPPRGVPAHDVAVLEEVVQQRPGFSPGGSGRGTIAMGSPLWLSVVLRS